MSTILFFIFMSVFCFANSQPMIIGHRGACGYAPENTLLSFSKAIEMGVDAIELDVHTCKSGELIVIHDDTLDRTTNGKGEVSQLTLSQIKEFRCDQDQKIPTLEEVFNLVQKQCIINIELKGLNTANPVADLIQKFVSEKKWSYDNFFVSSFDHPELVVFHQLLPAVKTGALMEAIPVSYASFAIDAEATHAVLYCHTVNQTFVDDAHQKGLKVFVYTASS